MGFYMSFYNFCKGGNYEYSCIVNNILTTFNFTNRGNILAVFQALGTKPDFRDKLNMYDETGLITSKKG